jgi:lipid II:glycine glycyltransferase (peptidoglycan interpeptide bridge formation enzyme)
MAKSMHFEIADAVDGSTWDAEVQRLGGSIFPSSVWASYLRVRHPNLHTRYVRLYSEDNIPIALALMFAEFPKRRFLSSFTGCLWSEASPVMDDSDANTAMLFAKEIEKYAKSQELATLSIGSFAGSPNTSVYETLGFLARRYWEFRLDLADSEDALWDKMEYKRHKNIRKAARSGVILEDHNDEEGIAALRQLQGDSSQRIMARGGVDIRQKDLATVDPISVLLNAGLGRIVCAKVEGQVVSAGLFTYFNGIVYHTLSGHSELALRTQSPTYLLWETMKRYKAEGARWFNFGGCAVEAEKEGHSEHGVYSYKKDFGGERLDCATFHKVLFPIRHGLGTLMKKMRRRMQSTTVRRNNG